MTSIVGFDANSGLPDCKLDSAIFRFSSIDSKMSSTIVTINYCGYASGVRTGGPMIHDFGGLVRNLSSFEALLRLSLIHI